jgi:hypothetical protein
MLDRRLWLLLGISWLSFGSTSRAEPRIGPGVGPGAVPSRPPLESHQIISKNLDQYEAEGILIERLHQGKVHEFESLFSNKELLKQLTRDKLTPEHLRLLKILRENPDQMKALMGNQQLLELLNESKSANKKGLSLTDQNIRILMDLAEKRFDPSSLPADQNSGESVNGSHAGGETDLLHKPSLGIPNSQASLSDSTPEADQQETWVERQLGRITASLMDDINDPANSGAFERALRSLGGIKTDRDGSNRLDLATLWKKSAADTASWMVTRWEWPGRLAESSRDAFRGLRGTVPAIGGALERIPAASPSSTSGGNGLAVGATVLAVVLLLVAGWKHLEKRGVANERGLRAKPGAWPVNPMKVASREELVGAFEYLAFLRLGPRARTSNHLAIAARLEEEEPEDTRRAAVLELARLYERARYDPDCSPFGEADLLAARRDLTLLGGGAAA